MKNRWLILLGSVFVALLLAIVAVPFFVHVDDFRPRLESEASRALGRKVKLGKLSLSVLSGKIDADDIEIADDPGFSNGTFFASKSVAIAVELKPLLLQKQVKIIGIVIEHPQITLLQANDGNWNFSSIGGSTHKDTAGPGLDTSSLSITKFALNGGTLTVNSVNSNRPSRVFDNVNIDVQGFSFNSSFSFRLATMLPGGGDAHLIGTAGPLSLGNIAKTPLDATIKANNLHIAAYGFVPPESGIDGLLDLDDTLHSDGNGVGISGILTGSAMKLAPKGTPVSTVIRVKYIFDVDLDQQSGTLKQADVAIGKAQLQAKGKFQGQDLKSVSLQLAGTNMPIDEFQKMVPALDVKMPLGSHLEGGILSIKLKIEGPIDALVITGHVSAANTKLVGYNLGEQLGSMSAFAGKAVANPDTFIKSMDEDVTINKAGTQSDHIISDLPSVGPSTGQGMVTPDGKLDFKMMSYPTGGMAGSLTKMASVGTGKGGIPVAIVGTIQKPVIVPNVGAAARSIAGQTVKGAVSVSVHAVGNLFTKKKPKD
jgi:AsmA protein